jgi:hypothetical protein
MGSSDEAKWVVASRLRDHLLLPSERKLKTLWKEVHKFSLLLEFLNMPVITWPCACLTTQVLCLFKLTCLMFMGSCTPGGTNGTRRFTH